MRVEGRGDSRGKEECVVPQLLKPWNPGGESLGGGVSLQRSLPPSVPSEDGKREKENKGGGVEGIDSYGVRGTDAPVYT